MHLETILSRINDFHSMNDPYRSAHFPIYQSATFDIKKQAGETIFDYSRTANPTRSVLEEIFTLAEKGAACVCTNTGISALALLCTMVLKSGDSILTDNDIYGGTNRLLRILKEKNNIVPFREDLTDLAKVEHVLQTKNIALLLCESPTNPGMQIIDIAALSALCHKYNTLLAVDNSLATFVSQTPLVLGADFSLFSATKFISGHGAAVSGALVVKDTKWAEPLRYYANAHGFTQAPFESFLVTLGLPTLHVRMKMQETSALAIAEFLASSQKIASVAYPLLTTHPQHALAVKQMKICPSVLTCTLSSPEDADTFVKQTTLFGEKVSFGNTDSRAEQPAKMSHASLSTEELQRAGITHATVRLSIGLENVDDLLNDLQTVLENLHNAR